MMTRPPKPDHGPAPGGGPEGRAPIDDLLRQHLEPDPERSRALVAAALATPNGERNEPRPQPWRWALTAMVAAALLGLASWQALRPPGPPEPAPLRTDSKPLSTASVVSISNTDGPLTVTTPGGGRWIVLNSHGETP